jgi:hypothetical protein
VGNCGSDDGLKLVQADVSEVTAWLCACGDRRVPSGPYPL